MSTFAPNQPPTGFYSGQQDPQYYPEGPKYSGQTNYPSQAGGYPPQAGGYPPQAGGYPPQAGGYPSQAGGYPPQTGYPLQQPAYPTQPVGYSTSPSPYDGSNLTHPRTNTFCPAPGFISPNIQQGMYGSSYGDEPLTANTENFEFSDKTIRHGFIRKVYSILMCQLAITSAFIALFTYHKPTQKFVANNSYILLIAFICMIVTLISMACCTSVRRKAPMNFVFLFIFTLAESVLLGVTASSYDTEAVLMAAGVCAAVCLGLSIFAFQTKWDFTVMGGVLFVAVIILMIFGFIAMIFPGKTMIMVYASLGALIFCVYLVYDTQVMIGGKYKYSISPEEYIFAALNLYLDVVNIFLYILTIIGVSRD